MTTPSLDDLAVFVAISRARTLSAAAAELGVPKSSVSRSLARLEEAMGVELVHRTTRRTHLSTAGEALLARAAPHVSALDQIVTEQPDRHGAPAGLLRITCTIDFGAIVVAEVVARFVERYPEVEVEVNASNALVDLVAGGYDLAIRFSPKKKLSGAALVGRRLGTLRTILVASPAYLAKRGAPRTPKDLADHDWITYVGAESLVLDAPAGAARLSARGRVRCDDMFVVRGAARNGAGVALLPMFLAEPDIAGGLLVPVLPKWQPPSGAIWLVHPASRHVPPKVAAFRDMLIETLRR